MNNNTITVPVKTMSSLELVKIINDLREDGQAELAHSDFLKKVVKVLGEVGAGNFSATYKDVQNKVRPCYNLPKREANLMVMSESHKVQAAVYDRMVELEQKQPQLDMQPTLNLSQLIPVFAGTLAGEPTPLINARQLFEFLEPERQFNDWIKYGIARYDFIENQDFIIVSQRSGGRPSKEYHLTLGMAKELSMMKRRDKGNQARRYFIDCEKALYTGSYGIPEHLQAQLQALQAEVLRANPRLQDVMNLSRVGYSQVRIADMLHIAPATVWRDQGRLNELGLHSQQLVVKQGGAA